MRKFKVTILITLSLVLCSLTLVGRSRRQEKFRDSFTYEPSVRAKAKNSPLPVYPEDAISRNIQGLVDSAVLFDEYGNAKHIKILESPDPLLSKAVEDAFKLWTVKVDFTSDGLPLRRFGELRFHFVINDGVASVVNPLPEEQEIQSKAFRKVMDEESRNPRYHPYSQRP